MFKLPLARYFCSEYQCPSFEGQAAGEYCKGQLFRQWQSLSRDRCSLKCEAAARLFDERQKALYGEDPKRKMCCSWEEDTSKTLQRNKITGEIEKENKTVIKEMTNGTKYNQTNEFVLVENITEIGPCQLYGEAHIETDKHTLHDLKEKKHVAVMCPARG